MRKVLVFALALAVSTSAWAASGGGGGSSGGGSGSGSGGGSSGSGGNNSGGKEAVKTCKAGFVYDRKQQKCIEKSSALIPDSDILEQAWVLAKSGRFEDGRELFALVAAGNNAEALNGMGYTNRKLGNFDVAVTYYKRALAIDPNYLDAREYLGEGYATFGMIELAKQQLAEIARRGGTNIEQYEDLAEVIDEAVKAASAQ